MSKVMIALSFVMLAGGLACADTIVPGSCVVVRGGGTPNMDCVCKVYQSTGNAEQDEYNMAHGYTTTLEIMGPCISRDCRDYRADQWEALGCYDNSR